MEVQVLSAALFENVPVFNVVLKTLAFFRVVVRDCTAVGRGHVEIERRRYLELKTSLLDKSTRRSAESLVMAFYRAPYEPYASIRRQLLNIWRAVNRARRAANRPPVPVEVVPLRRRSVRLFEQPATAAFSSAIEPAADSGRKQLTAGQGGDFAAGKAAAIRRRRSPILKP